MKDMYELDTVYCNGFEDGSGGGISSNPYSPEKEADLFEEYERGYFDGMEV